MKTKSGKNISKIGIGSYGIGGRGHRDMKITEKDEDEIYIEALVHTLKKGINFTEISLGYGQGQALTLFKKAFDKSEIAREDLFITNSLYPRDLPSIDVIKEDIDNFYKIMDTAYADSTLVDQSLLTLYGEEEIYKILQNLLTTGKTKYVSMSNSNSEGIRRYKKEFGDKFVAHEGHLSFEIREVQDAGIFELCKELGIENIIWRPLRRGLTFQHSWPLLVELSKKYQKTQDQIILNWICNLGYHPMVMSKNKGHIDENFSSTDFEMSKNDYKRMTDWRPQNYHPPKIDWEKDGQGAVIVDLAKDFEKHSRS